MNIKVTIGWVSFVMLNVNANEVEAISKAIEIDSGYIEKPDGGYDQVFYKKNNRPEIKILFDDEIPQMTESEYKDLKDATENGQSIEEAQQTPFKVE